MDITLRRASVEDAEAIWKMQLEAFAPHLQKYRDFDTSPAAEPLDKVKRRLMQPETYFYFICADGSPIGAVRVVDPKTEGKYKRVSPLFILPAFQGRGIAQQAMKRAEQLHGASGWELDTILQEPGNCHLYEKLGYRRTGKMQAVNDKMTLVFYRKE